jgi:hypothetical protein
MVSHVYFFWSFLFYCFVQDSKCCGVICAERSWGLDVTQFSECNSELDATLGVAKARPYFWFICWGDHILNDGSCIKDWAIQIILLRGFVAAEKTGLLGGCVSLKLRGKRHRCGCVLSCLKHDIRLWCLGESPHNLIIDLWRLVSSQSPLFALLQCHLVASRGWVSPLRRITKRILWLFICWYIVLPWEAVFHRKLHIEFGPHTPAWHIWTACVADAWGVMLKFAEHVWNISRHGNVTCPVFVIPFQSHAWVCLRRPVSGEFIAFQQSISEMISVLFSHVFDSEIVHYEGESDGPRFCSQIPDVWRAG